MYCSRPTIRRIFSLRRSEEGDTNTGLAIKSVDDYNFVHACTIPTTPSITKLLASKPEWVRHTIISKSNPQMLLKKLFISSYMIEQEIKRHLTSPYWYIIHPYSKFNMLWEQIMFVVYFINWFVILFQIANHDRLTSTSTYINFALQFPCLLDIGLRFGIGYYADHEIVLNQRQIVYRYMKSWLITDVITTIPFQVVKYVLINRVNKLTLNFVILYQALKILTYFRLRRYFKHSWMVRQLSYVKYMICSMVLTSILCYYVAVICHHVGKNIEQIIYNKNDRWNGADFWHRNLLCLYIIALKFYNFSFPQSTYLVELTYAKVIPNWMIQFGAYLYHLYMLVKVIQFFQYRNDSIIKYQEIVDQLKSYMCSKRLPLAIKKSLIEFYEQRFQYRFFNEKSIHENLSESLRSELIFHCGHLFIRSIDIFRHTPSEALARIVSCLKPEIYMPNDLIIKAGTVGDCMYFIASGTVSIITTTGQELLHLEDGDYFGEISLFTNHGKRISNIVALEYCELYRLDKSDYDEYIAIIPDLAAKFHTLAMQRSNATSTIEEQYKTERRRKYNIDEFE